MAGRCRDSTVDASKQMILRNALVDSKLIEQSLLRNTRNNRRDIGRFVAAPIIAAGPMPTWQKHRGSWDGLDTNGYK
jgi:hypothetical protein